VIITHVQVQRWRSAAKLAQIIGAITVIIVVIVEILVKLDAFEINFNSLFLFLTILLFFFFGQCVPPRFASASSNAHFAAIPTLTATAGSSSRLQQQIFPQQLF
tara:strand:- start:24 stop:335 length:312 start_codon:yes stop_codon:yes gene_type:complete